MQNENKPVNLGKYSEFIQVPKPHLRLRKKVQAINVISLVATDAQTPESYEKMLKLHHRLSKVQEVLGKRNLKFIKQWFAHDAISRALSEIEKDLGIENS